MRAIEFDHFAFDGLPYALLKFRAAVAALRSDRVQARALPQRQNSRMIVNC